MSAGDDSEPKRRPPQTLDELRAEFASYKGPDLTPLTAEEKEALRERLNAPGGARTRLTHREKVARWEMGLIRKRQAITAIYEQVRDEHDRETLSDSSRQFGRGVLRAIEFATGAKPTAPVTGEHAEAFPPPVAQLSGEQAAAADVAQGLRRHPEGQSFGAGVEHTIMWLLARTDQRPWGRIYDS